MAIRHRRKYYLSRQTRQHDQQVQAAVESAAAQLGAGEYTEAVKTCQEALPLAVRRPFQRAELLNCLGTAQMMLKQYDGAYATFSETLSLIPNDAYLWFNRGLASRFTMRSGQALRDFERAVALEGPGAMASQYVNAMRHSRQVAQQHMAVRGENFGLDQLIEQEELFQQAVSQMAAEQWQTAEHTLRRVIALGDGPSQPWSNLGACLMMQQRYHEAEAAYGRALVLDPHNQNTRHNLKLLAHMRQTGQTPASQVVSPFDEPAADA